MNQDEHQRERMRAWVQFTVPQSIAGDHSEYGAGALAQYADVMLEKFDKRFPAPVEPIPVPDQSVMGRAVAGMIMSQEAELASLRTKARYWDAVGSGKMKLVGDTASDPVTWWTSWRGQSSGNKATAEEAVQAAIDAGALK